MNREFATHLQDAFRRLGAVDVRRMFGGAGVFRDGLMIALVVDEVVYLKADEAMAAELAALGRGPFGPFHCTSAHSAAPPSRIALRTLPTSGSAAAPARPVTRHATRPLVVDDLSVTITRRMPPTRPSGSR